MSALSLFPLLDILGTLAFGLSGAMVAIRRELDLFGILVLAAATGTAGGITRDLMLGRTPPEALTDLAPLALSAAAGLVAFAAAPTIERFPRPVMLLDAMGLGLFAVAGCQKALAAGLAPPGAVLLGVITAIGGGILRDIMAAEIPRVLREEVYALAALAGAAAYAAAHHLAWPETASAAGAALLAVAIRLASVRLGWRLPRARRR
ncbi:trimeric intracellular cation channel family protein [Frigidibacter sp. MR17.24]|uniref:trimeric intracellular cation channel family protein n=1 Tax=Frigidibacter sp. MR17.24 TaxID=3127345 RepID=UPI003012DADB